jgi:hypothetical protein
MTKFWTELLPKLPADRQINLTHYGSLLQQNKNILNTVINSQVTAPYFQALLIAMAMIETTTMTSDNRDCSKDGTVSANISLFNLSIDLLQTLGYKNDPLLLNNIANLPIIVQLLKLGFDKWGCESLLNYVRGGRTAFNDGHSYDAYGYRNTVATILRQFDKDPTLLWNDVRVEIVLQHV